VWTGFIWHRIRASGGLLWILLWTFGFYKRRETCSLFEGLLALQEGLCPIELVIIITCASSKALSKPLQSIYHLAEVHLFKKLMFSVPVLVFGSPWLHYASLNSGDSAVKQLEPKLICKYGKPHSYYLIMPTLRNKTKEGKGRQDKNEGKWRMTRIGGGNERKKLQFYIRTYTTWPISTDIIIRYINEYCYLPILAWFGMDSGAIPNKKKTPFLKSKLRYT